MTVKNALEILDAAIEHYNKTIHGMQELIDSWQKDHNEHIPTDVGNTVISILHGFIAVLKALVKALKPRCRHPKKMIDTLPDGTKYCMSCNLDL